MRSVVHFNSLSIYQESGFVNLLHLCVYHGLALTLGLLILRDAAQAWRGTGVSRSRAVRYWQTIGRQWAFVAGLAMTVPLASLVSFRYGSAAIWISSPALWFILIGDILAVMYAPIVLAWGSVRMRRQVLAPWRAMRWLAPTTAGERVLWGVLSVTTGVCEEIVFRGFVVQYLMRQPWGLSLLASALVSCVLFGLGHAYQGLRGVLQTMLLGAALSGLLLLTGNLALPMLVHILINLRLALLPPLRLLPSRAPHVSQA